KLLTTIIYVVNAAPQSKRTISDSVQSCVNGLTSSNVKLLELTEALKVFKGADGYTAAVALHTHEQALDAAFKITSTDCCAITATVSDEEATAVFGLVGDFVPDITNSFDVIISKKPEFDALLLATNIAKADIKTLSGYLRQVDGCLIAVTPEPLLATVQSYMDTIDAKLVATYAAYNITS
ncbi:hypothetical protein INT47_006113, partial [Mucor saturninus]